MKKMITIVAQVLNRVHLKKEYLKMKRILTFVGVLVMTFTLVACQKKSEKSEIDVVMTVQEVLNEFKEKLGDSYGCNAVETEDRMSSYYALDMDKVDSFAAESTSNSSISMDTAVILKVKDGYSKDAAACFQSIFEQTASYSKMYNMDLFRVSQARIFISGNYVAYFILGQPTDWEDTEENQANFAAKEAEKVDKTWEEIFGVKPENLAVMPK